MIDTLAEPGASLAGVAKLWGLILGSAAFYVAALVAMKHWGAFPAPILAAVIALSMTLATTLEVLALRGERLGMVSATILGVEVAMLAAVSILLLGETLTAREAAGLLLIVLGGALAWS